MKILAVYTHSGETYEFKNAENVVVQNQAILTFEYVGSRSKTKTKAEFFNIAGYTVRTLEKK